MSFDKIEFVKPLDILQGGFNPNLPAEISVTEQLLYSIANNLAILNNNLINSGALQNFALIGDLMQEVLTDNVRVQNKQTSVFKTADNSSNWQNQSVFVGTPFDTSAGNPVQDIGIAQCQSYDRLFNQFFWNAKSTGAVVNQASSTYSFNVPVPSVSVSSSPATVNVNSTAPVVNNNVPVPTVNNTVQSAVPDITVNATAPVVNNVVDVPSVTNEISVQSAVPDISVNATAPVVNVSSAPATVNVSSTAPVVNNNIPVPSVSVSSSPATVNVSSTAPTVNVSSSPAQIKVDAYDDSDLISKIEEMREVLEDALNVDVDSDKKGLADILETALMSEVETDIKMGLADIVFERDSISLIDYPVEMLTEPSTTKKLRSF